MNAVGHEGARDDGFINPQTRPPRPLFGCERGCLYVDECEDSKDCIKLHPITPIEPFEYPPRSATIDRGAR